MSWLAATFADALPHRRDHLGGEPSSWAIGAVVGQKMNVSRPSSIDQSVRVTTQDSTSPVSPGPPRAGLSRRPRCRSGARPPGRARPSAPRRRSVAAVRGRRWRDIRAEGDTQPSLERPVTPASAGHWLPSQSGTGDAEPAGLVALDRVLVAAKFDQAAGQCRPHESHASSVNAIISHPFRRMPPMAAMPPARRAPPTPRTTRPPVSTLSDAAALARIVGGRSCRSATSGKNEMRSVSAARYAISVQTSRNSGL